MPDQERVRTKEARDVAGRLCVCVVCVGVPGPELGVEKP